MWAPKVVLGILRWLRTIRYLRPVQIYGRIYFNLHCPAIDISPHPSVRVSSRKVVLSIHRKQSLLHPWVFRFFNEEHKLDGWDNPLISKLWRYNLNYFDDLMAEGAENRLKWHQWLMLRWVHENPSGCGTGWEPYPTSIRIVNWIRWVLAGNTLPPECLQSLAVQVRWLSKRLEYHLLGNHLWANAKALVFAGIFFDGVEANQWLITGLHLSRRELREQILADGGHFELSPMYHSIVIADLLELAELAIQFPDTLPPDDVLGWRKTLPRMLRWLAVMTHPDGKIALFNDAAFGIAPQLSDLEINAKAIGIVFNTQLDDTTHDLPGSGYVRLQKKPAVLIADVGNIGPDYLPGHAHADTLSFELSLYGKQVIVDTGTSRYDVSEERLLQRGTCAHNTVQVDGKDSSEVWGSFRVARRARPIDKTIKKGDGVLTISCAHDGYECLQGRSVHERQWNLSDRYLKICDNIKGNFTNAVARFHFHPDVRVVESDTNAGRLLLPGEKEIAWRMKGGRQNVVASTYHPEFGLSIHNSCLEVEFNGNNCEVEFVWN